LSLISSPKGKLSIMGGGWTWVLSIVIGRCIKLRIPSEEFRQAGTKTT